MYLGCAACEYVGCGDCRIHGDDGAYQLGIVPLLLFAAPAIARAVRNGRARRRGAAPAQPPARPTGPAAPPPGGPRPGLITTIRQVIEAQPRDADEDPDDNFNDDLGGPMNYPAPNALGAPRWPFRQRRCVTRPAPGGGTAVVDADTNEMVGYLPGPGDQGMGADYFGAGYDQFAGPEAMGWDDDEDDGEDEIAADELGAEVDDAIGAAEAYGDDSFLGAADDKLQNKIARLDRQIDDLREKSQNVRNPFAAVKRKKLAKKIAAKQRAKSKLQSKLRRLQGTQAKVNQAARGIGATAAAGAGAGAAAAMLARQGLGGPPVWNTRAALNEPSARVADPRLLAQLRRNQAADGLRFGSVSPPGSGRQTGIQFYANIDTGNPRNAITVPVAGISAATTLRTRSLPFATCTIVGFQTRLYGTDGENNAIGLVRDLQTEGGTNLFLASGWLEASQFSDPQAPQGLRSYPQLQTTNYGSVFVAAAGDTDDVVVLTCSLIVDVVSDDTYGLGVPGVYAG